MPGLLAGHAVEHCGLEAALVAPAQVHAEEHLGPVLRVSAARAGVDREDGVAAVVLAGEGELQLHVFETWQRARPLHGTTSSATWSSPSDSARSWRSARSRRLRFDRRARCRPARAPLRCGASRTARTASRPRSRVGRTAPRDGLFRIRGLGRQRRRSTWAMRSWSSASWASGSCIGASAAFSIRRREVRVSRGPDGEMGNSEQ